MFKNFTCENNKCKKDMKKNFLHCAKCFKKFCCNKCINIHLNEFHDKNTSKDLPVIKEKKDNNDNNIVPINEDHNEHHDSIGLDYNKANKSNTNINQGTQDSTKISNLQSLESKKSDYEIHDEFSVEIEPEPEPEIAKPVSIFIKSGQFLQEYDNNPFYDFSNFELRKDQPLGKGAFGDVITGIHKQEEKKYAIKVVSYNLIVIIMT